MSVNATVAAISVSLMPTIACPRQWVAACTSGGAVLLKGPRLLSLQINDEEVGQHVPSRRAPARLKWAVCKVEQTSMSEVAQ